MEHDLSATRALIWARRKRAAEVGRRFAAHREDVENRVVTEGPGIVVRCDQAGHRKGIPKLAEVHLTRHGALFISKIKWAPSDQLNLRPWERDRMLGDGLDDGSFDRMMTTDDLLTDWMHQLNEWERGHPSTGPRWLADSPPHVIHEVIDLPDGSGRRGLWTRCPLHLHAAEEHTPENLIAVARRA